MRRCRDAGLFGLKFKKKKKISVRLTSVEWNYQEACFTSSHVAELFVDDDDNYYCFYSTDVQRFIHGQRYMYYCSCSMRFLLLPFTRGGNVGVGVVGSMSTTINT